MHRMRHLARDVGIVGSIERVLEGLAQAQLIASKQDTLHTPRPHRHYTGRYIPRLDTIVPHRRTFMSSLEKNGTSRTTSLMSPFASSTDATTRQRHTQVRLN